MKKTTLDLSGKLIDTLKINSSAITTSYLNRFNDIKTRINTAKVTSFLDEKKTFLENNTDIQENSYRKYMNEKGVLDLLNQLKLKFGSNFLEEENSIQWIQNGKFIHRGNIPRFILEKYQETREKGI